MCGSIIGAVVGTALVFYMFFFLDDAASGFVTGVILPIDGGFSAYSGV